MNYTEILAALREFTSRERVDFLPLAGDATALSRYGPVHKYVLDLKNGAKPETAAEDLFGALCRDVLELQPTRQVGVTSGYVDFMLPERRGDPLPLELKPLFHIGGADAVVRDDVDPAKHDAQIRKYLRDHEYLILTDLRTAWFFSARDYPFEKKPFAHLPFADFLARCRESRSVLDTLRRAEDTADKPELEQQFFEDLKIWFDEFAQVKWRSAELATESIILLINKLIFARTIEDFGLVQYRFTQDEFARYTELWEPKGAHRVIPKFLASFEDFFDEYYDTEIFSVRIWDRLDQNPENLKRFSDKLNFVLGVSTWDTVMSRGIVHYNYRRIDEDIFGKSYEMFLAANRKGEGIYYTPAGITAPMADSLVASLAGKLVGDLCTAVGGKVCDFALADRLMAELAELRVADTACGSGGFLIKVLRAFWREYQRIDAASRWVVELTSNKDGELYLAEMPPSVEAALAFRNRHAFGNDRILIARILLRHVFGADKDAGALEVAKTNIWKEAVKLSPADYNYRELRTDVVKILPNLELNFHCADSLVDVELAKQTGWLAEYHRTELRKLAELRANYIHNPMRHESLDEALALRTRVRAYLLEHFQHEGLPGEPAAFALHFWPCWFDAGGAPRATPGFDGIIGNPPWEGFKPFRKEFAASFYRGQPQFSKMGMDGPAFDQWFEQETKTNAAFAARWTEHETYFERHKEYFGRTFTRQGTGDWNLFKLFIERDLLLVRQGGQFSLLVPSSLQTDEGCAEIRRWFTTENRLEELTSFENRGYTEMVDGRSRAKQIFPDIDSRFKFGFFKVVRGEAPPAGHAFAGRFYLHDPKDISAPPIRYAVEMIRRFSPHNESFMEFRTQNDYALSAKIRGTHRLLEELDYKFQRELHMTDDNRLFLKVGGEKPKKNLLPLFEGKMIFQFDAAFGPVALVVSEKDARTELLRKEIYRLVQFVREQSMEKIEGKPTPKSREALEELLAGLFESGRFKLQYEFARLGARDIGSSTNERTLIAALIPARACIGNTINFLRPFRYAVESKGRLQQSPIPEEETRYLLGVLNSLTLNYYIRSKVSFHVNIHQLYELPVAPVSANQTKRLLPSVEKLLANPHDVPARAALEVFIARELYGLTRDDWKHLTATFTFGGGESKAELDDIVRQSLKLW